MDSSSGWIPKKKRTEKHCVLCKDKGGKHDTHNTKEDGSLKSSWVEKGKSTDKKSEGRSYAQLLDHFSKLEKSIKKGKKSASHKKKHSMTVTLVPILDRELGWVILKT